MTTNRKIFGSVFVVVLMVLAMVLAKQLPSENKESDQITAVVKKRDFSIDLHIIGSLDAAKSHMISSGIEGTNGKVIYLINDGKWVEKGTTLVRLDRALFEKEVVELESQVESYTAAVKAAEQVVAFENNQVKREIVNAEYGKNVAILELKRL